MGECPALAGWAQGHHKRPRTRGNSSARSRGASPAHPCAPVPDRHGAVTPRAPDSQAAGLRREFCGGKGILFPCCCGFRPFTFLWAGPVPASCAQGESCPCVPTGAGGPAAAVPMAHSQLRHARGDRVSRAPAFLGRVPWGFAGHSPGLWVPVQTTRQFCPGFRGALPAEPALQRVCSRVVLSEAGPRWQEAAGASEPAVPTRAAGPTARPC